MLDKSAQQKIISRLKEVLPHDGVKESPIPGLTLMRSSEPNLRQPVVYLPSIYVVLQGSKRAYIEDETYNYDAFNYLVLTVALPIEAHVICASESQPYLALRLDIDLDMVRELLLEMGSLKKSDAQEVQRGIFISTTEEELVDNFLKLLTLSDQDHAQFENNLRILVPMIKKEIVFRVLCGQQGDLLKAVAQGQRQQTSISEAIQFIQHHFDEPLEIQTLANAANMSISSFHQYFKGVTGLAPLQYIKSMRLHHAKRLLLQGGHNISDAAFQVGYSSASQFSREYKRFFNMSPRQSIEQHLLIS
ncbi:MAG: AraC family transcriptional regulator [Bermanella sp.]